MRQHGSLPRARQDGLVEEAVGEELLIYDRDSHTAHCLSPIAACVWRYCDGERDVTELAQLTGVSEDLVADALHVLREKDLVDSAPALAQSAVPDISRREAIGRITRYGAAATAGSLIVSATAATPAMASSGECKGSCECVNEECENNLTKIECEKFCEGRGGDYKKWVCEGKCEPPCKGSCECENGKCVESLTDGECDKFCEKEGSTVKNWLCDGKCG